MTKDQLRQHLLNAPPGTTPGGIISALRSQGVQMEGDPSPTPAPPTPAGWLDPATVESQQGQGWSAVAQGGLNILKSGARFAGGILDAGVNVLNPDMNKNTVANLGKLAVGTGANTVETIASFLGDKQAEQIFNAPGEEMASNVGQFFKSRYDSKDHIIKTLYEDPVGFLGDLLTAVSAGGTAIGAVGKVGELATAARTAGELSVPLDSAAARIGQLSTGAQAIGDSLTQMPTVANAAGKAKDFMQPAIDAVGNKVTAMKDAAAEGIMAKTLKLKPTDRARIGMPNMAGTTPEKWLLDRGITGNAKNIGSKLDELSAASKAAVDEGLSNITKTYDIGVPGTEVANASPVRQALNELGKLFEGTVGNEDVINHIKDISSKREVTLSDMNEVKRLIDRNLEIYKNTGELKSGAQARGLSNIRDTLKTMIENEAEKEGFAQVKDLNKTTQVSREISDAIAAKGNSLANNRALSLTDFLALGGGHMAGGPVGAGAVFVIKRIAESPVLRTKFAGMLHSLGTDERAILSRTLAGEGGAAGETVLHNLLLKTLHHAGVPIPGLLNEMNNAPDSSTPPSQ